MKKPILSICIPTYNRAKYLKTTLDSLIKEQEFVDGKVEIVISDNNSTDDTSWLCNDYLSKYNNILYNKNDVNIHDENFPKVISLANGLYRKVVNDSYICLDGSLKYICAVVEKYKFNYNNLLFSNIEKEHNWDRHNLKEFLEYDLKNFILKIGEKAINLLHFGLWESDVKNALSDISTSKLKLWQFDVILKNIKMKQKIIVVNKRLFNFQNVHNKSVDDYNVFSVFHDNYFKILSKYKDEFSGFDYDIVDKNVLMNTLTKFMIDYYTKKLRFNQKENLPWEIHNYYHNKPYYLQYLFFLFLKRIYVKIR